MLAPVFIKILKIKIYPFISFETKKLSINFIDKMLFLTGIYEQTKAARVLFLTVR